MLKLKKSHKILLTILILIGIGTFAFYLKVMMWPPKVKEVDLSKLKVETVGESTYRLNNSWLKKNEFNFWEMYLEGKPYEMGLQNGALSKDLILFHEQAFVDYLYEMIPSKNYLRFLKYFIAWFNKDLDEYIPLEYQQEIYGVSQFASDQFDFIAPSYHRILNYHGAHDMGHAIQNMNLVACTAFGVWGEYSKEGDLLIGRNFDFYAGEQFLKNKMVSFYQPEKGHKFMLVTWGGMIGVVSGMNDQGLTVTLNAAKSTVPTGAKTPVSILAREILQYAENIEEAYEIAKSRETFVSESFMIGSAKDKRVAVIEKSPEKIDLFETQTDYLTLTNHFQSDTFKDTKLTQDNIKEGASMRRLQRTNELVLNQKNHTPESVAKILRDQKGFKGKEIGMGNEKVINQLVAHHAVIFRPEKLQFWISEGPYQLGKFIGYDLNTVFSKDVDLNKKISLSDLTIAKDPFLDSPKYQDFLKYQAKSKRIKQQLDQEKAKSISEQEIQAYLKLNPDFYHPYFLAGQYYAAIENKEKATLYFKMALKKEIPRTIDRDQIIQELNTLKEL